MVMDMGKDADKNHKSQKIKVEEALVFASFFLKTK